VAPWLVAEVLAGYRLETDGIHEPEHSLTGCRSQQLGPIEDPVDGCLGRYHPLYDLACLR
jgi:hypothetical protein